MTTDGEQADDEEPLHGSAQRLGIAVVAAARRVARCRGQALLRTGDGARLHDARHPARRGQPAAHAQIAHDLERVEDRQIHSETRPADVALGHARAVAVRWVLGAPCAA